MNAMKLAEGEQLIEALKNGEIDAVISRDQLFFLRLMEEEQALEQRVHEQADQLRNLATELTISEQRERSRISEILHDHLQQLLVAIRLEINGLQNKPFSPDTPARLSRIASLVDDSIAATRNLSVDLAPPIQGLGGFSAALEWLARWMQEQHGLQVMLELNSQAVFEQEQTSILVFQCVRELLFNVIKHAQVTTAGVTVDVTEDGRPRIIVSDSGTGFDPSAPTCGFGLCRIRERLTLLGWQFKTESEPGKGSRFVLTAATPPSAKDAVSGIPGERKHER